SDEKPGRDPKRHALVVLDLLGAAQPRTLQPDDSGDTLPADRAAAADASLMLQGIDGL
ncbi:MAG: hypothetical protein INH10_15800, partial [Rhodocyclaceae bacterium]|nr:hypothetical protein [Rhodocyclaceae bacterium]